MYEEFVERYFGTNESIIEFANTLIETNNKQALKELNNVVKVLDISQTFKKTDEVISKIEKKYQLNEYDPVKVFRKKEEEDRRKKEEDRRKKEDEEKRAREIEVKKFRNSENEEERIKYWESLHKKES